MNWLVNGLPFGKQANWQIGIMRLKIRIKTRKAARIRTAFSILFLKQLLLRSIKQLLVFCFLLRFFQCACNFDQAVQYFQIFWYNGNVFLQWIHC